LIALQFREQGVFFRNFSNLPVISVTESAVTFLSALTSNPPEAKTEDVMLAQVLVLIVTATWACLMALCLPVAFRLQARPQSLPRVALIPLPYVPNLLLRAAALLLALMKVKF
jgi:hypothetical protein